ncbi:phosphoglycerate kinase [Candidatus Parcubacteria bacterium]|nr:phosphoglycerate kinase [Candidatus Parcubacteria bacterium]
MQEIASVRDADLAGKSVLVRVDFNVQIKDGKVVDDTRIRAALPTLTLIQKQGPSKIILLTHLGRPKGKQDEEFSLKPVEERLKELTEIPFEMHENLRFDPREEEGSEEFARELATLGQAYVNEAFSNSHRSHTSMVALAKLLPHYIGLQCEREIRRLTPALDPAHPALAVIGGAKFETKIPILKKILLRYDKVLLGGALANDMLKVRGLPVGSSLVSNEMVPDDLAQDTHIELPTDAAFVDTTSGMGRTSFVSDTRAGEKMMDIGPHTASRWAEDIKKAKFLLWNGTMGVYEKGFTEGTDALAQAIVDSGVHAVVGGGDTVAAINKFKFDTEKVFVSTGGGAMVEFLMSGTLPAIEALRD